MIYKVFIFCSANVLLSASLAFSQPDLVSRAPSAADTAAGGSFAPIISGNGRYVVFVSRANNLSSIDGRKHALDVFVRDLSTGELRNLTPGPGLTGDRPYTSISDDGEKIVFSTEINDGPSQIFMHDWLTGATTLLSTVYQTSEPASAPPDGPAFDGSTRPQLSIDGRHVLFESMATNLVANDTNGLADIFLRDLQSGDTALASAGAQGIAQSFATYGQSFASAASADAQRVAFISTAANLVPGFTNVWGELYVRDIAAGLTFRGSSNVPNYLLSATNRYACLPPVISSNGNSIVFKMKEGTRVLVFHHDLQTQVTTLLSSNSLSRTPPVMSRDGQWVAFEDGTDVVLWHANSGDRWIANIDRDGLVPQGTSLQPVLSADGTAIAFLSTATNLVSNSVPSGKFQLYIRDLSSSVTRLASLTTEGSGCRDGVADTLPSLSANGRRVAFDYSGSDLTRNDFNGASDVFLFDLDQNVIQLLSARAPDRSALTSASWIVPEVNSVSEDGQRVTFVSYDMPGIGIDTNRARDAFVVDLQTRDISPLSLLTNNLFSSFHRARQPLISGNGQHAIFLLQTNTPPSGGIIDLGEMRLFYRDFALQRTEEVDPTARVYPNTFRTPTVYPAISRDGRLVCYQKNDQLYLRDMSTATNVLISVKWNGMPGIYPPALDPIFSPDSRWVVFRYSGWDLQPVASQGLGGTNLYARDWALKTNRLVSVDEFGQRLYGFSYRAVFYATNKLLFYGLYGTNTQIQGATTRAYLHDLEKTNSTLACINCTSVSPSVDGRWISFLRPRPSPSPFFITNDIYLKDLSSGTETLITVDRFGTMQANRSSLEPIISGDGRYVVFVSYANNLVLEDTNNAPDIFAYDRLRRSVILLTPGANGASISPMLAGDGRTVIFQSMADNLATGDYNAGLDIFSVRLGAGDSDNDGMDDNWEVTYFNGLTRDGTGDFDNDGHTDLEEYLAGTDPTKAGSVFEVLTIRSLNSQTLQIVWASVPNRRYLVQAKASMTDQTWTVISSEIVATDFTSSWSHTAGTNTFYRVAVIP